MSERRPGVTCRGKTKAGRPCRCPAVMSDGYCRLHSPNLNVDTVENARAAGRRSGEVRRERGKSISERINEHLEAVADLRYRALREAIDRGDRAEAIAIVNRALGVSEEEAVKLGAVEEMRARRARSLEDGSRWRQPDEGFVEL